MRALDIIGAIVVAALIFRGVLWTLERKKTQPKEGQTNNEK